MPDDYQQKLNELCREFEQKMAEHKAYIQQLVRDTMRKVELAQAEELAKSIKLIK